MSDCPKCRQLESAVAGLEALVRRLRVRTWTANDPPLAELERMRQEAERWEAQTQAMIDAAKDAR